MIVVSLLLILVAVTLLVLGLTGGSSTLLISSIVASLLAAVFLVIGARQAAARRRTAAAAPDGVPADPAHDPFPGGAADFAGDDPRRSARRRSEESETAASGPAEPGDFPRADSAGFSRADAQDSARTDFAPADFAPADSARDDVARDDFASADSARAGSGPASDDVPSDFSGSETILAGEPMTADSDAGAGATPSPGVRGDGRQAPDYDHASSVIGAARGGPADDHSWRRAPGAEPATDEPDEFGEPDADDPADEPLPQAVRPGDAVRMARIDAEVLVVDGRPRYHLADCAHLVGRLTEPLPAREAVELGFSPCGLCRPVDRLVEQAAHH